MNRLATAQTSSTTGTNCWGETFSYDIWGNLLSIGAVSGYAGCTQENLSVTATTSNRISGDTYDGSGNLTLIPGTGGASYAYNGENQMTSTAGVTYTYDGDGKRVKKSSGALYWYGMGSDALDETDGSGNLTNEYVFFGGKRIARRDPTNNVFYYFEDHLGTSRVITNAIGTICYDVDFYPFGGERTITNACPQNYKFTGKERDSESNLDNFGARYYSSSMGRFSSPDEPLIDQDEGAPQSWNLYSYARNNPLKFLDLDGHACYWDDGTHDDDPKDGGASHGECDQQGGTWIDPVQTTVTVTASNPDALPPGAIAIFSDINRRNILNNTLKIAGAGALIGATGGAACYYLCPAATVTTLGITAAKAAPLLPVVFGALQKLQQLGISVEEANEIVASPESQKLVDTLRDGNINVVKEVGGQLVRITTNPEGTRIISAGLMRANQIANGIASGRFVPKQ